MTGKSGILQKVWRINFSTHSFWNICDGNDLSLHCTDFFLERRNRSYYLHCLEEVDLQMRSRWGRGGGGEPLANHHHHDLIETSFGGHDLQTMEIIRSVSSFEKNPYNVSSNLSLLRAHFSKVHVFCEVVEVMEVMGVI